MSSTIIRGTHFAISQSCVCSTCKNLLKRSFSTHDKQNNVSLYNLLQSYLLFVSVFL